MDKAVHVRGSNRLFVEVLRVQNSPFDPCDLRRNQRGAALKRLRRVLGPHLELLVMCRQSLEMFRLVSRRRNIPSARVSERSIEAKLRRLEHPRRCPIQFLPIERGLSRGSIVSGKDTSLDFAGPIVELGEYQIRIAG